MFRISVASMLAMLTMAGSAMGAVNQAQKITPAVKAFINGESMKYAKTLCIGHYGHVIESDITTRGFDFRYRQAFSQFEALKANGLYYEADKQGSVFWFLTSFKQKYTFVYAELRSGKMHTYGCDVHL